MIMKTNVAEAMLAPVAYDESSLPSLRLARSSRFARRLGKLLAIVLALGMLLVTVAPWQQSVSGSGDVVAYAALERQQTLQTPIKGRIVRLAEGLRENMHVAKGQFIAEIADIDDQYLNRLESQLEASRQSLTAAQDMVQASERSFDAANSIVASFEAQVIAYQRVREETIASATAAVDAAKNKVEAELQQLEEHQAALAQVRADFDRQKSLFNEKIISQLKFQESERKLRETIAKVAKSEAYVEAARNELIGKERDLIAKEQKAQIDIDYAIAGVRKSRADAAKSESEIAKATGDLNKAKASLLDSETKVARQRRQIVTAPFDGFVTQITPNQGSQILKVGDPICVIVPDTQDRAVQVWLSGNDAPLVQPGRHVRLQFEGWPAVQFAGWPSVAVGTFGGDVISVDATDDGKGKFRILVLPDPTSPPWPSPRYLRQGVRVNGWVLLDQVPLWYEVWRNLNGFPPVVSPDEASSKQMGDVKVPKIPKS